MSIALSDEVFGALRARLEEAAGLRLDATRRETLALSVAERMARTGASDPGAYLAGLDAAELQELVDAVTIPETQFYRTPPHISALQERILPELTDVKRRAPVRIWSAGCSTGEEPYSVALLLHRIGALTPARPPVTIVGSDVSTRAIAAARVARYGERAISAVPQEERARFFTGLDTVPPTWQLSRPVRAMVEFVRHNVLRDPPPFPPGAADLILCRNVTIYFSRATTAALIARLHAALRPGGYLLLGHAETLWQVSDGFDLERIGDAFVYRREGGRPRPPRRRRTAAARPAAASVPAAGPAAPVPERSPLARAPRELGIGALRAAVRAGRHAQAVDAADRLLAGEPLHAEAHYLRGVALANLGRDEDALASLRGAAYLDPGHGAVQFLLAGVLERLGQPGPAARAYLAAADGLRRRPAELVAGELAGRRVDELPELCRALAARAERAERAAAGPA